MANKMTPISQDVVVTLKARTSEMENSIKSLIQKLQGTNLSDSFTKGYVSSLQKVLDKSQELKKTIGDTSSVNSKTTAEWSKAYNKLSSELTKTIAKLEGSSINFSDLVGFDNAELKKLTNALDTIKKKREDIYKNAAKRSNLTPLATNIKDKDILQRNVLSNIGDENKVASLIDKQIAASKQIATNKQADLDRAIKELAIYQRIQAIAEELKTTKLSTTTGKQLRSELGEYGISGANRAELTQNLDDRIGDPTKITDKLTKKITNAKGLAASALTESNAQIAELLTYKTEALNFARQLAAEFQAAAQPIATAELNIEKLKQSLVEAEKTNLDKIATDANQIKTSMQGAQKTTEDYTDSLVQLEARQTFFSDLQSKITQIFGLANAFQGLRRFVQESWIAIKELDAAFTEIAVVTDKTTGDLWESFDTYNKMAQQLGVTTTDAIKTSALYYQQGLDTAEVMTLTTETIKMARIANMDFATATQAMTSAIRGFKLEMSDAQAVTDTYSALAAKAAVDTDQLATAISKTASIAGSAGLSLEDTSAFLTQIIETTQEAPETAGTAFKTIIARFTELKKNPAVLTVDVEGEEVSANKVEEALKTANVALRDTEGNFRDLGDVFLELSSKWNSLDRNTQRYIATTAAGSRQQSRFIAMMDNYERTMELVGIANDSAGAGAIQFAKTLDSVSARVNKLKSNFEALIGNLVENDTVKGILDALNDGMTILVNASEKGIVAFGALIFMVGKAIKSALTLVVGQFANAEKKNEELRAKIGKTIKTTVVYQPDLTLVNEANAKLKVDPITVGTAVGGAAAGRTEKSSDIQSYTRLQRKKLKLQDQYVKSYDNVIAKQKIYQDMLKSEAQYTLNDASGISQAYIQNAKKALDSAIKDSRTAAWKLLTPTIASTVSSGFVQGMTTGIISGDWKVGLATGIISTVSSALSNPAITSTIGRMFTKSGGTVATALKSIGGKLAAAVPYAIIAAGVAAIGYGLWKWTDPIQSANRKLKKAQDNLDKINNSLESSRANFLSDVSKAKGVSDDIEAYKKLSSQVGLTTEEQESLNGTVTKLAEQFPQIITGYTEAGQVIIDQKTNWQEILELQRESIALSQAQYAGDVVASAEAREEVRLSKLEEAQTRLDKIYEEAEGKQNYSTMDAEENEEVYLEYLEKHKIEIEALEGEINKYEKQGALYVQEKANAYKQIADSLVSTYQAFTTKGSGKVDSQISEIAQNELARRIEGLGLNWNTEDEEVKKDNRAKAQAEADAYLIALQKEFESSHIDMSKVAEHMATDTQEQFISFLRSRGITEKGKNATLYATLMLDFDTENAGVEQVLAAISGTPYTLKGNEQEIAVTNPKGYKSEDITSVISKKSIAAAVRNKGAQAGADYVQKMYEAVINYGLDAKIADYLAGINITTQQEAKDAASYIAATFDTPYTAAVDIVFNYKTDPESNIDKPGLFDSSGIKSFFEGQIETNSADKALKSLNSNLVDLAPELTKALVEEFPELSGALKTFANDSEKSAEAIDTLRNAIIKASNNKKSIDYFKKLSEQIEILNDTTSSGYAKDASKDILKDFLDISDLKEANEIIDTYMSDIEAAANGSVEAWDRVQTAIKEAKLAEIGYDILTPEQQESALDFLNQFTKRLDELSNGDYSADFALNGVDYTDPLFAGIIDKLANIFKDTDAAIAYLETLGGISIEPSITQISVPRPTPPAGEEDRAVYQRGHGFMTVPKITYKVKKKNNYNPGYVGRGTGSSGSGSNGSGGGSSNDYETKVDKYYNEINAIEKLNTELKKLAELRDKGNLTPEEYRNNLNQTAKYYKNLQSQLHDYSEKLRADRAELETEVANLKLPDAISMKDGKLSVNKAKIDAIADATTREKIDDIITRVDKLNDLLKKNSDGWWEVKYALEELADKYLESFINVEDKIRNILIKQDQDEIDTIEKKYDKLKKADEDYLKALKDNIDKRRRARDKETDYNDLAKKEKRLALLKRDTSGVYAAEILSLEEEIAQTRRELSDKEVDDMIDSLEEQATKRADAHDKELKELQELQKDKEKSMADYNKEVDKIMQSGAENVLKWLQTYDEEYIKASETAQKKYLEGWKATINEANGYVNNVANGTVMSSQDAAATKAQDVYSKITAAGYGKGAADIQSHDAAGAYNWYKKFIEGREDLSDYVKGLFWDIVVLKHQWDGSSSDYSEEGIARSASAKNAQVAYSELVEKGYAQGAADIQSHDAAGALKWYNDFIAERKDLAPDIKKLFWNIVVAKHQWAGTPVPGYSEGGVVDTTGLVMVHGTTTKPEAFLSAADTKNFQILMELLNKAVNYRGDTQSDVPNTLQIGECQIIVEVGSIADDYDVDQAIDKVKQSIIDNSNYRNVNIVTRKK